MADGIKIRALNLTTAVRREDVLIVDKLNPITNENITYQISVNDFADAIIANPDNTIGNLADVVVTNPQEGEVLTYDGDTWVNLPPTGGGQFSGSAVIFESVETPVVYRVTVGNRTPANRFDAVDASVSGPSVFYINGIEAPAMILSPGIRYRFDQSDLSNVGYNFRFYSTPSNTGFISEPYSNDELQDVTVVGTPGQDGAYTELFITQKFEIDALQGVVLTGETLLKLFYNTMPTGGNNNFMGNSILNSGHIEGNDFDIDSFGPGGGIFPMGTDVVGNTINSLISKVQELENIVQSLESNIERLIEIE